MGPIVFGLVGERDAAQALGFCLAMISLPVTVGSPVAGLLYDHLGSYTVAFHVAGIAPIAGALIMLLIPKEPPTRLPVEDFQRKYVEESVQCLISFTNAIQKNLTSDPFGLGCFPPLALSALLLVLTPAGTSGKRCTRLLPGLDRQALGVDVTRLDLMPLDLLNADDGFKSPVKYDLPDQVWFVSNIPYGSLVSGKRLIKTTKDIRSSYSVNAGVDVTTQKFGFSASGSYTKTQSTLLKNTRNVEFMAASFSGRRVDLQHTSSLTLGEQAERMVNQLPRKYTDNPSAYEAFIRQFGTHYISEGKFGGVVMMHLETETSYFEEKNEETVSAQVSASFFSLLKLKGGYVSSTTSIDASFTSATTKAVRYFGGRTNLLANGGIPAWQPTTFAQPWLYSTKLNRISDLVRDATKRASLNQAISDYVMRTYLTVELRRVLQMLPFTVRNNREVTKLQNDINTKSTRYPLVEREVESLGADVMKDLYDLGTHEWHYSCSGNSVIKGWKSVHHDWWDTRTHKLKCCRVLDAQKNFYCWWTGYKNAIMDDMKVVATASRQIIRGVAGDHSDWH
ncbi:hypothetical protein BaRGS_00038274, partial [Batillaria attramentaria]